MNVANNGLMPPTGKHSGEALGINQHRRHSHETRHSSTFHTHHSYHTQRRASAESQASTVIHHSQTQKQTHAGREQKQLQGTGQALNNGAKSTLEQTAVQKQNNQAQKNLDNGAKPVKVSMQDETVKQATVQEGSNQAHKQMHARNLQAQTQKQTSAQSEQTRARKIGQGQSHEAQQNQTQINQARERINSKFNFLTVCYL